MHIWMRNVFAVLRGCFSSKTGIGRRCIRYKNVKVIAKRGGKITCGKQLRIEENATLSAVNGGRLCLGDNVGIGQGNLVKCQEKIEIGSGTLFGPNVLVYDHDHVFDSVSGVNRKKFRTKPIIIGENCWIGANTVILKGAEIGDRCVVGAGSVISGHYPSDSLIYQKRTDTIKQF
ncbi:MAG: acyltransferase [Lachnospiraceae bacterium]|nr:acyltransferase [Lachnospiraceae bacterium]